MLQTKNDSFAFFLHTHLHFIQLQQFQFLLYFEMFLPKGLEFQLNSKLI